MHYPCMVSCGQVRVELLRYSGAAPDSAAALDVHVRLPSWASEVSNGYASVKLMAAIQADWLTDWLAD